eukprot:8759278-Lingulodinium_polyedra.AAC.1
MLAGKAEEASLSGQGREKPKDRFGHVFKCSICQSEEHLRARRPNRSAGSAYAAMQLPQITVSSPVVPQASDEA